jgi:alkylation response protein AidB-like acyl-CoA dehydrogenase
MRMEGTPMPRLMPEAIYQAARTREDAVELLGKYGYSTEVPFERASRIIDAVAKAGWKYVPENQIP